MPQKHRLEQRRLSALATTLAVVLCCPLRLPASPEQPRPTPRPWRLSRLLSKCIAIWKRRTRRVRSKPLFGSMPLENAAKIIFLPPPFTPDDPTRFDDESLIAAEKGHHDKLAFLGGGGTLNVMIQEAMHSGDAGPESRKNSRSAPRRSCAREHPALAK